MKNATTKEIRQAICNAGISGRMYQNKHKTCRTIKIYLRYIRSFQLTMVKDFLSDREYAIRTTENGLIFSTLDKGE